MKSTEKPGFASEFINGYNAKSLLKSIQMEKEEQTYSVYCNYPALLLRKKSEEYPGGRTTIRFKQALRRQITIIDKNKNRVDQNEIANIDKTEVDDAEQEVDNNDISKSLSNPNSATCQEEEKMNDNL